MQFKQKTLHMVLSFLPSILGLSPDKENLQNAMNEPTNTLQPKNKNNFMETMNRNVLANALHGLDLRESQSDPHGDNIEGIADRKETGWNNWYLSGLQTVKLRSPSDYENLTETESGDELSDFDDNGVRYDESEEDGVKPFSETEDEEEDVVLSGKSDFIVVGSGGGDVCDGGESDRHVYFEESDVDESDHELSGGERTVIEVNSEVRFLQSFARPIKLIKTIPSLRFYFIFFYTN